MLDSPADHARLFAWKQQPLREAFMALVVLSEPHSVVRLAQRSMKAAAKGPATTHA